MKEFKKSEKQYIFMRDGETCRFCGKALSLRQASLDHYLPKSKGGPDEIFNIVLSCKTCNKLKKDSVPQDCGEVMLELLKKGIADRRITGTGLKLKHAELTELAGEMERLEQLGELTVFQSRRCRIYVKHNRVIRQVQVNSTCED